MKARYIGGESKPGSGTTVAFGMTLRCGEAFDVPPALEGKVSRHPAFEVVMDAPPVERIIPATPDPDEGGPYGQAPKKLRKSRKAD